MNHKIILFNTLLLISFKFDLISMDYGCGLPGNTCNYECFRYCIVAGYGSGGCRGSNCKCDWKVINETLNALQGNPNMNHNSNSNGNQNSNRNRNPSNNLSPNNNFNTNQNPDTFNDNNNFNRNNNPIPKTNINSFEDQGFNPSYLMRSANRSRYLTPGLY